MDEILIEEKRYVSSKQAAKITGYAKDYIGQLCREGRVPARLVGRSWYVLESAIQDHRFGNPEDQQSFSEEKKEPVSAVSANKTWESPRYEPDSVEELPYVGRADTKEPEDSVIRDSKSDSAPTEVQSVHDSWKEWFSHVAEKSAINGGNVFSSDAEDTSVRTVEPVAESDEKLQETDAKTTDEITDVKVPIYVTDIYAKARESANEALNAKEDKEEPAQRQFTKRSKFGILVTKLVSMIGIMLATIFVALAIIGSGYLDSYIISISQARIISGVVLYAK